MCRSLFFNKVVGLSHAVLLKKSLRHKCFPVNFCKIFKNGFFIEHLQWLLLEFAFSSSQVKIVSTRLLSLPWDLVVRRNNVVSWSKNVDLLHLSQDLLI